MGNYRWALIPGVDSLGTPLSPDVTMTRQEGRTKYGVGLSLVREVSRELGWFARLSWNDGLNET